MEVLIKLKMRKKRALLLIFLISSALIFPLAGAQGEEEGPWSGVASFFSKYLSQTQMYGLFMFILLFSLFYFLLGQVLKKREGALGSSKSEKSTLLVVSAGLAGIAVYGAYQNAALWGLWTFLLSTGVTIASLFVIVAVLFGIGFLAASHFHRANMKRMEAKDKKLEQEVSLLDKKAEKEERQVGKDIRVAETDTARALRMAESDINNNKYKLMEDYPKIIRYLKNEIQRLTQAEKEEEKEKKQAKKDLKEEIEEYKKEIKEAREDKKKIKEDKNTGRREAIRKREKMERDIQKHEKLLKEGEKLHKEILKLENREITDLKEAENDIGKAEKLIKEAEQEYEKGKQGSIKLANKRVSEFGQVLKHVQHVLKNAEALHEKNVKAERMAEKIDRKTQKLENIEIKEEKGSEDDEGVPSRRMGFR